MPRPKVRDEDRRRATKACVPCQNSKKRCDAQSPCANCCRRNCTSYCIYDPEVARRRRQGSKTHRRVTQSIRDTISSGGSDGGNYNPDNIIGYEPPSPIDGTNLRAQAHAPQTPESTQEPQSQATPDTAFSSCISNVGSQEQSLEVEKVPMGDSPSLAFLDFLRHTFHHYMGPTPFTDKERAKAMLETVYSQHPDDKAPDSELTLEEKQDYIQRFLISTTGIIYVYSPEQMLEILKETEESRKQNSNSSGSSSQRQKSAIIDIAIAIGGQGCRTTPTSLYYAQKHFDRGQKLAFEEMLLDPTVDLVAIFTMTTIYLMCACKREGAFIYLGIAIRLAHAIGLHLPESYNNLPPKTHRFRLQVWKSLRILEISFGSVLGQLPTPGTSSATPSVSIPDGPEPWSPEFTSMTATYQVCTILEQIVHHDSRRDKTVESIRDFLSRLRDWSSALPSSMRKCTVSSPISLVQRRQVLGNFAVSAFYYYSVMLATRPLLISYMLMKLKRLGPMDNVSSCPPCHTNERETRELAQVCIDAAILLVETTRRTQSVGLLIQNMQLLKAWIFSACLIMGLSIFVELTFTETYSTCETGLSLQNGIGIIRDLDRTSPQSHRYLEILNDLRNALQTYRERLVPPRREGSGQFLSQIFVVSQEKSPPAEPTDSEMTSFASTATAPPDLGNETSGGLWMLQQAAQATQNMGDMWRAPDERHTLDHVLLSGQPGGGEALSFALGGSDINWNGLSVHGTDNFLFEMEPFADMLSHFYNVTP